MDKNREEQLEEELRVEKRKNELAEFREGLFDAGDKRYAMKPVERLVFGFVALVLIAVVGALIRLIIIQ